MARRRALQPVGLPARGPVGFCRLALGAVLEGLRAVVEFQYADFASEAFKMLVKYAATQTVRRMPYDVERVRRSVEKTSRVLVTCEAPRTGCFGNTIVVDIARTSFESLDAPIQLVAAADTPVPFSPALEAAHLPTTGKLVRALRELLAY